MKSASRNHRLSGLIQKKQHRCGDVLNRRLRCEPLEKRMLMAGDSFHSPVTTFAHNHNNPADVDGNQRVSANDALQVINLINRQGGSIQVTGPDQLTSFADVNADNLISAADALMVINRLESQDEHAELEGQLVELLLEARDNQDRALTDSTNREITVNVGEIFYLELSYHDLRTFGNDAGAFQISTDILLDQPGVLTPVVHENQVLVLEQTILESTSGHLTFSMEGSAVTRESQLTDLANDPIQEIENAMIAFGYSIDQFKVSSIFTNYTIFEGQSHDPLPSPGNLGFKIEYTDFALANLNLPDLAIEAHFDNEVRTYFRAVSPINPDGTYNGIAVRNNIDSRSRSYPSDDPFGSSFYGSFNFGFFDPLVGFDELGSVGQTDGSGIPGVVGSFPEPFDAFSVPVFINQPVNDLTLSLDLADNTKAVLLYGEHDPIPQEQVGLNVDASSITVTAIGTGEAQVVGRHLFYDDSYYSQQNAEDAIATDKTALLPGESAEYQNYSNYIHGINGVMVDVDNLSQIPTLDTVDDFFDFRVGNQQPVADWASAPDPANLTVRPGKGVNGSHRIMFTWANNAIRGKWLQITTLAGASTGLVTPDVHYWGNAPGETGDSTTNAEVNATDVLRSRFFTHDGSNLALIDDDQDFNRDREVNATDVLIARFFATDASSALKLLKDV